MGATTKSSGSSDEGTPAGDIADHLNRIQRLAGALGQHAESVLDYHDLGIPKEVIRRHFANIDAELARLVASGTEGCEDLVQAVARPDVCAVWNSAKNLRYAAGAIMLTERFRDQLTPDGRTHAIACKILYEGILDTLDDLIDSGSYGFAEALDLMRHTLAPITARTFDPRGFSEGLRARLAPEQRHLVDFLTTLVATMQREIRSSPHGAALTRELERLEENWIRGQAATMYQKDPTLDVRAFLAAAERLPGPDADLTGIERLSGWISHTAAVTLLDLCFVDELPSPSAMEEHLTAWFYLDAVITLLNNVADLPRDLADGIANLFLIARSGDALLERRQVRGIRPHLAMADYEAIFRRSAEFTRRALLHAAASTKDPHRFYPFIALMIPVVNFAGGSAEKEDLLHAYLRFLARALHAEPEADPMRATTPRGTRSGPTRFARTASS